jgi:cell fate regulator YaaT (PSP1 superfamily)
MGCGSCGSGGSSPKGCKNNGGCSTGGCNRMNAYDWLVNMPFVSSEEVCRVVEVSFNRGSRKDYVRNATMQWFEKGDMVAIEGISGFDVGEVTLTGEIVRLQLKKNDVDEHDPNLKKILRKANDRDLAIMATNKDRERDILIRCRAIAKQLNLNMKLSEVEVQADGKKATFFYIADDRVDFRELIKIYAGEFKVRVEMRQIGARQEAAKVGGIGSCGRELCCSSWLADFKSVNTTAARYQNLSINQTKLSGQCGRLKCCLNFELDTYLDGLQAFPNNADQLQLQHGVAHLIKKDVFKNIMWYIMPDSNKHYPLSIPRVQEIVALNKRGERVAELGAMELTGSKPKEATPVHVELVGQISLHSLEKSSKKRRDKERQQAQNRKNQNRNPQNRNQANRPQGNNPQGNNQRPNFNPNNNPNNNQRSTSGPNNPNQPPRGNTGNRPNNPNANSGNTGNNNPQQKPPPRNFNPNFKGGKPKE